MPLIRIVANQVSKTQSPKIRAHISTSVPKSRVKENDSGNIAEDNDVKDNEPQPSSNDSDVVANAKASTVQPISDTATLVDNAIDNSDTTILSKNNEIPLFATSVGIDKFTSNQVDTEATSFDIGKVKFNQVDPKTTLNNRDINVNVTSITPKINEQNIVTHIVGIGDTRIKRIGAKTHLANNASRSFADMIRQRKTTSHQLEPTSNLHYNPRNTGSINQFDSKITPGENETRDSATEADIDTFMFNQLAAKITLPKDEAPIGPSGTQLKGIASKMIHTWYDLFPNGNWI